MREKLDMWQPIETAPKDGTWVLSVRGQRIDLAAWTDDSWAKKPQPFWRYLRSMSKTFDRANPPTHWMPLPDPPVVQP